MDLKQRKNISRNNLGKSNDHLFKNKIIADTPTKAFVDNIKLPNINNNNSLNKMGGTHNKMDFRHLRFINRPEEEFLKNLKIKPNNLFPNTINKKNNNENNKDFNAKNANKTIFQRIQSESNLYNDRNLNKRNISLDIESRKKTENKKIDVSMEQSHKNFILKKKSKKKIWFIKRT